MPHFETQPSDDAPAEGTPVCLKCFTPYQPLQHYCEECGETVGQLSPYIPFVNIRHNYGIFGTMWKRAWFDADVTKGRKVFYFLMILFLAPIMILGLPFTLWAKYRKLDSRDPIAPETDSQWPE